MRALALVSTTLPTLGVGLLAAGLWSREGGERAEVSPPAPFDLRIETETAVPSGTAVSTPTGAAPSPTATPYDGLLRRISAPAIGLDHPIEEIGLLANNELDVPSDALGNVGWYRIYDKPGWAGNAVFAAHVNYNFRPGPFANLRLANAGDTITVEMDDGTQYAYEVFFYRQYPVDTIPMGDIITGVLDGAARPPDEEWITLITCGGDFVETESNGLGYYLHRDVVVARRILR